MAFADLKNDYIFRRIFATHPDLLRRLLTDDERARIEACTDAATLDRWIDNVFGAKTTAEVLH